MEVEQIVDQPEEDVKEKICTICKKEKSCQEFAKNRKQCKHCRNNSPARIIQTLFDNAKRRAKEKNIEFTIAKEDIILPEYCPVFPWVKLEKSEGKYQSAKSYTVDRIDPTKGYTKNNIAIISWRANELKCDGKFYEIRAIYEYMLKEIEKNSQKFFNK